MASTADQKVQFVGKPAEGLRMNYHLFPQAQRGGLSYYPFSGVLNGLRISNVVLEESGTDDGGSPANAMDRSTLSFDLSGGEVKLDGQVVYMEDFTGTNGVSIPLPEAFDDLTNSSDYSLVVPVFVNPRRNSPVVSSLPPVGDYDNGDIVFIAKEHSEFEEYLMIREIYKKINGSWEPYDREITFESPVEGKDLGHNMLPFNSINEKDVTPSDSDLLIKDDRFTKTVDVNDIIFSRVPEKKVFHSNNRPPYVYGPGHAYLRESASIYLADIKFQMTSGGTVNSYEINRRRNRTQISI
jgi:hypothetical protein